MAIKELSQRQLRVGQEIKRIIASLIERDEIRNLHPIDTLVTITEARISPDLKYCHVYFISSEDEKTDEVQKAMQLAAGHIRKQIAQKTNLRFVPEIVFMIDESFAQVDRLERLLRDPKVAQDLQKTVSEEE